MSRKILLVLILLMIQNVAFTADTNLDWLLEIDPNSITLQELRDRVDQKEERYWRYHQVNGISWPAFFTNHENNNPDQYDGGADNLMFTGMFIAAQVFKYLETKNESDLDKIFITLRGLHILTHISGTPGVLSRMAYPLNAQTERKIRYPGGEWPRRIKEYGTVYENHSGVSEIFSPGTEYPPMFFYTRATRDQLTGLVFGLSVTWALLKIQPEDSSSVKKKITTLRNAVAVIGKAVYRRLREKRMRIKDHEGKTKTSAYKVKGLLKVAVNALYNSILRDTNDPEYKTHSSHYRRIFNRYFNFAFFWTLSQYFSKSYSWNLRHCRTFGIFLLEEDSKRKKKVAKFIKKYIWKRVKNFMNSPYIYTYFATNDDDRDHYLDTALYSLKALSFRPDRSWQSPLVDRPELYKELKKRYKGAIPVHLRKFPKYYIWQKQPDAIGYPDEKGMVEGTGLSLIFPYWMGRYFGFISN